MESDVDEDEPSIHESSIESIDRDTSSKSSSSPPTDTERQVFLPYFEKSEAQQADSLEQDDG